VEAIQKYINDPEKYISNKWFEKRILLFERKPRDTRSVSNLLLLLISAFFCNEVLSVQLLCLSPSASNFLFKLFCFFGESRKYVLQKRFVK